MKYDIEVHPEDITNFHYKIRDIDFSEETRKLLSCKNFTLSINPMPGAVEAVKHLYKKHKLIIATGRKNYEHNGNQKWVRERFGLCIPVYHTKSVNADVLVDDYVFFIRQFQKHNIRDKHISKGILFDRPWNRFSYSDDYITRVNGWAEVVNEIEEML